MKRVPQILALVVVCSAVLQASDTAKTLFKRGGEAEARQDYGNQGQLQEAPTLFEEAAAIDPSNDLAAQEVQRTQQMEARPPVMLNPISDKPVSALEMNADIKTIYQTIGKLAGINVLFDPEYTPRQPLSVKLKGVSLQEALDSVALQSRTFWRAVTPNTIFVAQAP